MELKSLCILDFLRAAVFFLIIPFWAAVSIFLIISFRAASVSVESDSCFFARRTNFFALVLTDDFTDLFLSLSSSLLRWRFSADDFFFVKRIPQSLKFRRPSFYAFAFFAFGLISDFTVSKNGLHFDFSATRAKESLRCGCCTRVFTDLCHYISPYPYGLIGFWYEITIHFA